MIIISMHITYIMCDQTTDHGMHTKIKSKSEPARHDQENPGDENETLLVFSGYEINR